MHQIRSSTLNDVSRFKELNVIAVDMGFARDSRSCGLAWRIEKNEEGLFAFGDCIDKVGKLVSGAPEGEKALIIEAPLSGLFDTAGNQKERGPFEKKDPTGIQVGTRYWYCGPGA